MAGGRDKTLNGERLKLPFFPNLLPIEHRQFSALLSLLWCSAKAESRTIHTFHLFISYPVANELLLSLHLSRLLFHTLSLSPSRSLLGSLSLYPSVSRCSLPLSLSLSFFLSLPCSFTLSLYVFSALYLRISHLSQMFTLSYLLLSPTISPTVSLYPK